MDSHDNQHGSHHVTPLSVYFRVWGALIVFTVLTVTSSYIDFGGSNNILIAMVIATIKALLVILFFMGLKYEGAENNVTFFVSFLFLAIFVGLTGSDLFYRVDTQPVKVDKSEMPSGGGSPVDAKLLAVATPELKSKGQTVFGQQCIMCHGAGGHGDGPAAAALNPKPRNFTQDVGWKNGRTVSAIVKTLTNGLPGTPMPSFAALPAEDRFALAHYVRSLGPTAPTDSAQDIASVQALLGGGGPAKPRLPIDRALEKTAQEWEAAHGHGK